MVLFSCEAALKHAVVFVDPIVILYVFSSHSFACWLRMFNINRRVGKSAGAKLVLLSTMEPFTNLYWVK